ncbi:hypothetical protein [Novosphingobium guangzhouense]|uniref:Uncharacterized protein n=1 Tax=Novosphingobium guangzhouense TaxID=1850347 RepID=A0A2K2G357_9SPHN|nr:hypothetical protein [Novosphingobium guangzhouense]PNU05473.1 hypothetical protein A8V01_15930 [Novosphingobium guangzhouense]
MTEGFIYSVSMRTPDGENATWFEIMTVIGGREHWSKDHSYKTEAEARAAAATECDTVDPVLYSKAL